MIVVDGRWRDGQCACWRSFLSESGEAGFLAEPLDWMCQQSPNVSRAHTLVFTALHGTEAANPSRNRPPKAMPRSLNHSTPQPACNLYLYASRGWDMEAACDTYHRPAR